MTSRNELLADLAADAAVERREFLDRAAGQLERFLEQNTARIDEVGGLTLIDEEPDYLSVAPDGTLRSRTRFFDEATAGWISETEVIESAAELVELYNPSDVFGGFADAAREAAGLPAEPTAAEELFRTAGISPAEAPPARDPYVEAADDWAAGRGGGDAPLDEGEAAHRLYELSLAYVERSQRSEAALIEHFQEAVASSMEHLPEVVVVDDDDERLILGRSGTFRAEVIPEGTEGEWKTLHDPDDLVEFYDPTDVFSDLADAVAEAYPGVAPELRDGAEEGDGEAGGDGEAEGDGEAADDDDADGDGSDGVNGTGRPN